MTNYCLIYGININMILKARNSLRILSSMIQELFEWTKFLGSKQDRIGNFRVGSDRIGNFRAQLLGSRAQRVGSRAQRVGSRAQRSVAQASSCARGRQPAAQLVIIIIIYIIIMQMCVCVSVRVKHFYGNPKNGDVFN